jgi:sarcosine oxidase, subunit beta
VSSFDVAVIGGGIVGTSAACFMAEAGARVVLFEQAELAAGASGRNSGLLQRPFDPQLVRLHHMTLQQYRQLAAADAAFSLGAAPAGLLLVSFDEAAVERVAGELAASSPELEPRALAPAQAQQLEPSLASGLAACRLDTGYPLEPRAATLAFARRARRAGAEISIGQRAEPDISGGRARGVRLAAGERVASRMVLVASGPSTPRLIAGWSGRPPISALWGVVANVELAHPPGHALEELGTDAQPGVDERMFSLVTAAGESSLGSTFTRAEPDAAVLAPELVERGATFVPRLGRARTIGLRACARPLSFDGRPIVGRLAHVDGLFVCAGHGPWGLSTGPASAADVSRQMLDGAAEDPDFSPLRLAQRA